MAEPYMSAKGMVEVRQDQEAPADPDSLRGQLLSLGVHLHDIASALDRHGARLGRVLRLAEPEMNEAAATTNALRSDLASEIASHVAVAAEILWRIESMTKRIDL